MRKTTLFILASLVWTSAAHADEVRLHVEAGGAHAIGGTQEREFGAGGGGSATAELAVGSVLGVQASAGGIVLSTTDKSPTDPTIAKQSTGTAFTGTVGVRFRPLGAYRVAGPWIDANGGLAQTGSSTRIAFDAHLGWDFRVTKNGRWDVGPFIGYTEILQPSGELRPDDAHILWAGIQVSLGASEKRVTPPPTGPEQVEPPLHESDGTAQVQDYCPITKDGYDAPEGCPEPNNVKLVDNKIVLDDIIHFEFNSPVIRLESYNLVRNVARVIKANPSILEVSIEGHADARGTDAYNQQLSEARAASTKQLLVFYGIDAKALHVIGYGKTKLKVPTQLAEAQNRRVEFTITRSADTSARVPLPPPSPKVVTSGKRGAP